MFEYLLPEQKKTVLNFIAVQVINCNSLHFFSLFRLHYYCAIHRYLYEMKIKNVISLMSIDLLTFFEFFFLLLLYSYCYQRVIRRESKTDSYSKDLLFLACVAFCVITFEPIMIQTCSAPQNDHLIFSFVKDIKVVVKKMTRNRRKTATYSTAQKHAVLIVQVRFRLQYSFLYAFNIYNSQRCAIRRYLF